MKKYLITQTQLEDTQALVRWLCFGECRVTPRAILPSSEVVAMLESLQPIEPLSDKAIFEIVNNSAFVEGKYMLPFSFAREIEAHITGGAT